MNNFKKQNLFCTLNLSSTSTNDLKLCNTINYTIQKVLKLVLLIFFFK